MTPGRERAAVISLLQRGTPPWSGLAARLESALSAEELLRQTAGAEGDQGTLFDTAAGNPDTLLAAADRDLGAWAASGITVVTVLDARYPENLREVHDRPPALFVGGALTPADARSVAVIGSRRASADGLAAAETMARDLARAGYVVVSGLAAGIDTAAHRGALAAGARTVAVIGTGLRHSYPPQNADLQRELIREHAVVSQFWPDAAPAREAFPQRNAVMSGLTRATVVVEAGDRSGARVQTRLALAHGRPVFLRRTVTSLGWALDLSRRSNVFVVDEAAEIAARLDALDTGELEA